jgi:hypothetical protein
VGQPAGDRVTGLLFDWTPKAGDGFVDWMDMRCRSCGYYRDTPNHELGCGGCGCAESPEFRTRGHVCEVPF